jgi:hypothetical protein
VLAGAVPHDQNVRHAFPPAMLGLPKRCRAPEVYRT